MRLKFTIDTNTFIIRTVPTPVLSKSRKISQKIECPEVLTMMSIADLANKNTNYPVKFEFHVNNQSFLG